MLISELLKPEHICLSILSKKRTEAILEVAHKLQNNSHVENFQGFYDEILARERTESTCLGNDVAFPHARTDFVKGMILAAGRSQEGVYFENAKSTVKLIFVIGTPRRMATEYLSVVGGLARLLRDESFRQQLYLVDNPEDFIDLIAQTERKV